jgi:hypothetical protein
VRQRLTIFLLPLALWWANTTGAEPARIVPREYLDRIVDDDPDPLPRSATRWEQRAPLFAPNMSQLQAPPTGAVFTPAEYEHNDGILIRWGSFNDVLTAMAVGISTGDPDATVYILVSGASQQSSANSVLVGAGADMSQVEFITYSSNSVWMRDYGPRFISEDAQRAMVDHTYNRNRPLDNAFPDHLALLWDEVQYDIPLTHGGGNFHLFATGKAYMSDLVLDENGLTAQQVKDLYTQYQNLDVTITGSFPWAFDGTKHIDMWMLPVDDDEVIIGQYPAAYGLPYTITETLATDLSSGGMTVYRTPGWNGNGASGWGTHYTYTNSVVFNNLVFQCEFNGATANNNAAAAVFASAFPSHQIIPVNCTEIIDYSGALHCIVMHVPQVLAGLFSNGFESGDTFFWSATEPPQP